MPNRLDKQTYSQIIASRPAWRAGLRAFGLLPSAPSPAWSAGRPRPATTVRAEYELTSSQADTKQHKIKKQQQIMTFCHSVSIRVHRAQSERAEK